jgi:hypothetical protein
MSDPFVIGAIRRVLKQKTDALPGACPDANELSAWMESRLNSREVDRFEDHVSRCTDCQQALALSMQLAEPEPVAAKTMVSPPIFSYRSSSIRLAFAAVLVVVVGVLLYQSTRQFTEVRGLPDIASNRAPAVASGGPAAAMRSPGSSAETALASNAVAQAPGAPQRLSEEEAKAGTQIRASRSSQARVSAEVPKKATADELGDLALQKNKAVDAVAAPPIPANEPKTVPLAAAPPPANQISLPLSTSNSISNSIMNVEIPPVQQATGQMAQAQAGRGGGGGRGRAAAAQQAAVQQTQQANVQQATVTQQASAVGRAEAQQMRMTLDAAPAEARTAREADVAAPKVRQALEEARLLLAKTGKKPATKKIGSRIFYRTANFWVEAESVAHAEAAMREMARDSQEFRDILAKEKKLSDLKDVPVLLYWNAANCLIR